MSINNTDRLDHNDDSISESEYGHSGHANDNGIMSCCRKIRNKISPYAAYEPSFESQHSISISSKTLESVQDAIECKISLSKAKLHRYLTTPNWGPKKKFAPYNIFNFPLDLFNDYGIGTKLYFEFVAKLLYLTLFISICYIPIYCMLYSVGKLNKSSSFEQFSLGNLGDFNNSNNSNDNVVNISAIGISLTYRQINSYIAYTDFICILLLLLFIIWFESTLKVKEKEYDDMTTTVSDFSVEVLNVPLNISSRRSLAQFFEERWGPIMDVSICYNDGHIVKMYQQHSKIINQFTKSKVLYSKAIKASARAKETNKLHRLQTKLDKSALNMLQFAQEFNNGDKHCVKAYVTFENEPERNNCLREYHRLQFKYCCKKNPRFVFQDHSLQICKPPEPSNILYLNHGYSGTNLFFRRKLTTILSTLIIIASFGLIFTAQYLSNSSKIDTAQCDESIVYDAADNNNCYCFGIGIKAAMTDLLCSEYFNSYLQAQGFNILSSFIIILVNLILTNVIYNLVEKEKHFTVSHHQSALATKIFFSQFMNTALAILIINCNLNSLNIGIGNIFAGEYDINFTYKWSENVGNSIIITMLMGCFNPHLLPILMMKYKRRKRENALETVSTQNELNEQWSGETFTLADRFGNLSCKICVILLYTPLLPLLWFILLITCCATYWFNKIFFLRVAKLPPKYDTKLAHSAVYFVKIGISLHLIMAIWVFGSKYRDPQYLDLDSNKYLSFIYIDRYDAIFKIIFNLNSLPFFLLFVLLHLINIFGKFIKNYICCSSKKFEDEAELLPFSQEYVQSENMELYLLCHQPTLKNAFGAGLLPIENILNKTQLECAEIAYKKRLAKEMIDELMNVDIETETDDTLNKNNKDMQFLNVSPEFWNIREVGVWLERLKCGKKYMYQFMFKKVNGQRLLNISDTFLEEVIEIKNLVHRSKILKAVRKLRIKAGFDPSLFQRKLTKQERKELETVELENYTRHLILTDKYTRFAKDCQKEIENV